MTTTEGGVVAVDDGLFALWEAADGRTLGQLMTSSPHDQVQGLVAESLGCLAEAGLLHRDPPVLSPPIRRRAVSSDPRVRAIIVVSRVEEFDWLAECVRSVAQQSFRSCDVCVLDNATGQDVAAWLGRRGMTARVLHVSARHSYAAALNAAIADGSADYYLLMNADVRLHEHALANLVAAAQGDRRTAAVAPKLRFWRAPAFLNGIGNRVPPAGWGTDNAVGQLDLGQFEGWTHAPSGCLTTLLLAHTAWQDVGAFDDGYPAYYEDADWAYRARLLGYTIVASPDAEALHVFGAAWTPAQAPGLTTAKLRAATMGRLRFICKVPDGIHQRVMFWNALREDVENYVRAGRAGDETRVLYREVWTELWRGRHALAATHRELQRRRRVSDDQLFPAESTMPTSMMWRNVPHLTCRSIHDHYAPLMRAGRTRPIPELGRGFTAR